jgi:hypothetical protein
VPDGRVLGEAGFGGAADDGEDGRRSRDGPLPVQRVELRFLLDDSDGYRGAAGDLGAVEGVVLGLLVVVADVELVALVDWEEDAEDVEPVRGATRVESVSDA